MPSGPWLWRLSTWESTVKSLWNRAESLLTVQALVPDMSTGVLADSERSVSPVIAVVLTAALAIVLSVTIGAFVLSDGGGGDIDDPSPVLSMEIDREPVDTNVGGNERIIISHRGGDTVQLSNLEITTKAICFDSSTLKKTTKTGSLVNLPASFPGINNDTNVNGDKIYETAGGVLSGRIVKSGQKWTAGQRLSFQIDQTACDVREGALTRVEVIHKPSNTVLSSTSDGSRNFQTASPADASYDYSFPDPRPGSAGFPDEEDILTVGITDGGQFPPEAVYLDVTVDDGTTTASANGSLNEWTGVDASFGADYNEVPENPGVGLVGAGDRVGNDLTSKNSGPSGGFGPLAEDTSSTTDIDVKVKFKGNIVSQKTLTGNGFEVDP